ncbi:hypothetical protein B0H11DRAFT_671725 [Mycena galericulata]|nr:hypothetical protein B0H11DRAFT_671725 [Mycena galericulata]
MSFFFRRTVLALFLYLLLCVSFLLVLESEWVETPSYNGCPCHSNFHRIGCAQNKLEGRTAACREPFTDAIRSPQRHFQIDVQSHWSLGVFGVCTRTQNLAPSSNSVFAFNLSPLVPLNRIVSLLPLLYLYHSGPQKMLTSRWHRLYALLKFAYFQLRFSLSFILLPSPPRSLQCNKLMLSKLRCSPSDSGILCVPIFLIPWLDPNCFFYDQTSALSFRELDFPFMSVS